METTKNSPGKIAMTYGLILGLLNIVLSVILYVTNNYLENSWVTSVTSFAIMILVIVLAMKAYKKGNGGFISLREALKTGVATALIGSIIGAIYFYIFATLIEPNLVDQIMDVQREQMLINAPDMTQSQIDQAMEMGRKFTQPWLMCTFQLVFGLFFGFIISLIGGLAIKQENPYQQE
ncbi:MAG: DUF4199 domain-containing protein [Leeuwenhoekiella sp.]